jgi:magnesium transporter
MLQQYSIVNGRIVQGGEGQLPIDIYVSPDDAEKSKLLGDFGIDEHTLASSVDPDEPPRLELEPNHTAIIIKYPKNYSADDNFLFKVKSMGIFVFSNRVVLVVSDNVQMFTGKLGLNVNTVQDVLLKVLFQTVRHFESHLRVINMCSEEIEGEINEAIGNRSLLNMFTLEKGLVYYVNALSGNGRVIERIKVNASKLGLTADNLELLDDLAIENSQSLDQAQVYSQVLSGLMDARASIVSNNLNVMMKNMNAIVIAVGIPTFFTGVGGMSEFTGMVGENYKWVAYPIFILIMIGLGFLVFWLIEKFERH